MLFQEAALHHFLELLRNNVTFYQQHDNTRSNSSPPAQSKSTQPNHRPTPNAQQDHYDFGIRAQKSVLVMAGAAKRAAGDGGEGGEDGVLISAIRDANLPKFTTEVGWLV